MSSVYSTAYSEYNDTAMQDEKLKLIEYTMRLPSVLRVEIHRGEQGGFWAKVLDLPGCATQASSFPELIEMVNDAVLTYFEVPEKFRDHLGIYIPERIKQELERHKFQEKIEDVVNEIISGESRELRFRNNQLAAA